MFNFKIRNITYEVVVEKFSQGYSCSCTGSGFGDYDPEEPYEIECVFYLDEVPVELELSNTDENRLVREYLQYCEGS